MSQGLEDRVASLENQMDSVLEQLKSVKQQHRTDFDYIDTFIATPLWKRWLFILDGWSGHRLVDKPQWRPWRRWWTS